MSRAKKTVAVPTDLDTLKAMLGTARKSFHVWKLRAIDDPDGEPGDQIAFDGFCLVFGSEDYGPYTQFVFNADGSVNDVTSNYATERTVETA
jgi:hypothetical protein